MFEIGDRVKIVKNFNINNKFNWSHNEYSIEDYDDSKNLYKITSEN